MAHLKNKRPLILVSNDDGIKAGGLVALVKMLRSFGDVVVAAPDQSYSAMSHAITVRTPLYAKVARREEGLLVYKINGTPVDCVKLAIKKLLGRKPDLVVSGINHGTNTSISVHYSGTLGAAREAAISHIPSIGFSLLNYSYDADFTLAAQYAERVVNFVLHNGLPKGTFLNVNIPDGQQLKGLKVVRQCKGHWEEEFIERKDPRNKDYYWLSGHFCNLEPEATDTDEYVISQGYVAVVPCQIDSTNFELIPQLEKMNYEL